MKEEFQFIDKALYFPVEKVLVIADLHIGYEEALNKQGIFLPRHQFKEIKENLERILKKVGIKEIVVLGDLKHEFGEISRQEWRETLGILDLLSKYTRKIILVKGNHDTILGPIARKRNVKVLDYYLKNNICFLHGDKLFPGCLDEKVKSIVVGHRHPAVVIRKEAKKEIYKCFLKGRYKRKKLIVMPSFMPLIEGSDIINEKEKNLVFSVKFDNFDVFIPVNVDETLDFGKIKELRKV